MTIPSLQKNGQFLLMFPNPDRFAPSLLRISLYNFVALSLTAMASEPSTASVVDQVSASVSQAPRTERRPGLPQHESLYWEYQGRALLQHPWKVVKNDLAQDDSYELYNLTDDLSETKDIAAAHPEIVAERSAKLDKIWKDGKKKETPETK